MRKHLIAFAVIISMVLGAAPALCDAPAKIGIVDIEQVMKKSLKGKRIFNQIKDETEKKGLALQEKEQKIQELQKSLESQAMVMNQVTRDEKERQMRIEISDIKMLQKKSIDELKMLEIKLLRETQDEIVDVVEKIGEKEKFLLVLERAEAGVMYFPKTIDLTERVIKEFDAAQPKE